MKAIIEPFRIKAVGPIQLTTQAERRACLAQACHNLFVLPSTQALTDC